MLRAQPGDAISHGEAFEPKGTENRREHPALGGATSLGEVPRPRPLRRDGSEAGAFAYLHFLTSCAKCIGSFGWVEAGLCEVGDRAASYAFEPNGIVVEMQVGVSPALEGPDDGRVRFFRKASDPLDFPDPRPVGFGAWLIRQFAKGTPTSDLQFAELERVCSNAGSLLCGAVLARPDTFRGAAHDLAVQKEAAVLSKRTADGLKASLADRKNTVLAWPWDHLATTVAWNATQEGSAEEDTLGKAIFELATAYSLFHREQLEEVVELWAQVATGVHPSQQPADLARMGADMLTAYEAGG